MYFNKTKQNKSVHLPSMSTNKVCEMFLRRPVITLAGQCGVNKKDDEAEY